MKAYSEIVDLSKRFGKPPFTWGNFFKKLLYWVFPPTLVLGVLKFVSSQLLGKLLGKILMRNPQEKSHHSVSQTYEIIRLLGNKLEPPSAQDSDIYLPRQFYSVEEAQARAVLMDCMDYGKETLAYDANDPGANPYSQVEVKNIGLQVKKGVVLDTYLCERRLAKNEAPIPNDKKIAVISCVGRDRSGQFLLPSVLRNALHYTKPEEVFKNYHQTLLQARETFIPNKHLLDFKPYPGLTTVTFDYRGIHDSTGSIKSQEDPIEDVMSTAFYLLSEGYLPENIYLKGHSLGGICTLADYRIKELFSHLDDPVYADYLRKIFGKTTLSELDWQKFIRRLRLHEPVLRLVATRTFSDLPWTIVNQKIALPFEKMGLRRLGIVLTWLATPFMYALAYLTNFKMDVLSHYLKLRVNTVDPDILFCAHKDFKVADVNGIQTHAVGDEVITERATLGYQLRRTWVEVAHRLAGRFFNWIQSFRTNQFESNNLYEAYEGYKALNKHLLFNNEQVKGLSVVLPDGVVMDKIHDFPSDRVTIKGQTYSLEAWFYMQFIPNCIKNTRDHCEYMRSKWSILGDPDEPHDCILPEDKEKKKLDQAFEILDFLVCSNTTSDTARGREYGDEVLAIVADFSRFAQSSYCGMAQSHIYLSGHETDKHKHGPDCNDSKLVMRHSWDHYRFYYKDYNRREEEGEGEGEVAEPSSPNPRRRRAGSTVRKQNNSSELIDGEDEGNTEGIRNTPL